MRLDPAFSHQSLHFLGLAHFMLGNYETAATIFRERILLMPETDTSRTMLAASLGHLGEIEEARSVWTDLVELHPKYVFREHMSRLPFANEADRERIADGLAKAGLLNEDDS